jgi:hypothetical protein
MSYEAGPQGPPGTNGTNGTNGAAGPTILSKYTFSNDQILLKSTYEDIASQTFTAINSSTPLMVSGTAVFLDGGTGSDVVARLVIDGTPGEEQRISITNGHFQQLTCLGSGTSPVSGEFTVVIQASKPAGGSVTKITASIMTIAQTTLSV